MNFAQVKNAPQGVKPTGSSTTPTFGRMRGVLDVKPSPHGRLADLQTEWFDVSDARIDGISAATIFITLTIQILAMNGLSSCGHCVEAVMTDFINCLI